MVRVSGMSTVRVNVWVRVRVSMTTLIASTVAMTYMRSSVEKACIFYTLTFAVFHQT